MMNLPGYVDMQIMKMIKLLGKCPYFDVILGKVGDKNEIKTLENKD